MGERHRGTGAHQRPGPGDPEAAAAAGDRAALGRGAAHRGDVDTRVSSLSGGNQQKVVLAKWLQHDPTLFLLDDPTRGVDVGARSELHATMRRLAKRGCALLICSTDMLELAEVCDRVLLMRRGRLLRQAETEEMSEAGLVAALSSLPVTA